MNIKKLNETLERFLEEISFDDTNVKELYDTIKPENKGWITYEEMDKIKDFLQLENKTNEELNALRNSIVRYWSANSEELHQQANKDWEELKEKNPNADFKEFDKNCPYTIMQDQMSAFTHVIDSILWDRRN